MRGLWRVRYQDPLRPVWVPAQELGRSQETIRSWAKQGRITSACDLRTRELLVDVVQCHRLHHATPVRRRRAEDA